MSANPKALQKQVDAFNAKYQVGQTVTVRMDNGEGRSTTTRSKAQVLSGHSAVIWLEGISGCYLLDRVIPMTEASSPVSIVQTDDDDDYYRPDASGYSRADEEWFFDMDGKP